MRRTWLLLGLVAGIALSSAHPSGQRGPTISDDLKQALARGERVRVIVQAEEDALQSLKTRHGRGLRRLLAGALTLDVSSQELDTLRSDSRIAHLSGDLPVVADMAITNKVTGAEPSGQARAACSDSCRTPGYTGAGIGVAVLDSGIARSHRARRAASSRASTSCRASPASPAIRSATARTSRASSAATRPPRYP